MVSLLHYPSQCRLTITTGGLAHSSKVVIPPRPAAFGCGRIPTTTPMPAAHGTVALHFRVTPCAYSRAMRRRNKRAQLQTESAASKLSSAQPFHRRPLCAGCHTTGSSAKWSAIHPRSSALRLLGKRISSRTRSSPNSDGTPCTCGAGTQGARRSVDASGGLGRAGGRRCGAGAARWAQREPGQGCRSPRGV